MAIFADKYIFGFQVSIDNAEHVEVFQRQKNFRSIKSAKQSFVVSCHVCIEYY